MNLVWRLVSKMFWIKNKPIKSTDIVDKLIN